ncbi:CPBP family glutamic-type intramembrane protease [Rothia sp. AR01]|uniref:CPBP family glutamic-type intramembrane protease n=1 Tax=Rothia santali TaxID=2949643 RepID=A0A9X2HL01_9MICC|nr:CPBP family glutamic-type intramembrane protease [Rothia santali]MCP3426208.1 CPBP family glutamic-type intramembrane protease [Rothia santali]
MNASRTTLTTSSTVLLGVVLPAVLGAAGLFVSSIGERGGTVFYAGTFFTAVVYIVTWIFFGDRRTSFERAEPITDILRGALIGLALIAVFVVGALMVRDVEVLSGPVDGLLDNARLGIIWLTVLTTTVNGVGEELFFRNVAVHRLPWSENVSRIASVGLYMLVTASMGVPLLIFAALVIGAVAQYEAKRSGALASSITLHLVWTLGMLLVLPPIIIQ